jgi:hypothetical protein
VILVRLALAPAVWLMEKLIDATTGAPQRRVKQCPPRHPMHNARRVHSGRPRR